MAETAEITIHALNMGADIVQFLLYENDAWGMEPITLYRDLLETDDEVLSLRYQLLAGEMELPAPDVLLQRIHEGIVHFAKRKDPA